MIYHEVTTFTIAAPQQYRLENWNCVHIKVDYGLPYDTLNV